MRDVGEALGGSHVTPRDNPIGPVATSTGLRCYFQAN